MANLQLLDYMKTQLKSGFKKDDLLAAVRKAGWQESAIQEVLRELEPTSPLPPSRPVIMPSASRPSYSPTASSTPSSASSFSKPIQPAANIQVSRIVQPQPAVITAKPAVTIVSSQAPAQPVRHSPTTPIAIDASGNPLPAGASFSPNIQNQKPAGIDLQTFGIPQLPQMRPKQAPAQPAAPVFRKSEFSKFAAENSGYSPVAASPAPAKIVPPEMKATAAITPASPIVHPVIQPVAIPVRIEPEKIISPASAQSSVSIAPKPAIANPAPAINLLRDLPQGQAVSPNTSNVTPVEQKKPAAIIPPLRINPAFAPGTKAGTLIQPEPQLQTKLTPASGIPADYQTGIRNASSGTQNPATVPGAFSGMRVNAPVPFQTQTVPASRQIGTGILPQPRPNLVPKNIPGTEIKKKKGHATLYAFLVILILLVGGGVFAYMEFPASVQQAQDSIQALVPSTGPTPDAILANALGKLMSQGQFSYKANLAGSSITATNSSTDIRIQGTASGTVTGIIPFPTSQSAIIAAAAQARNTVPALAVKGSLVTTPDQGIFFNLSDISGTENSKGIYNQYKNTWISSDANSAGLGFFAEIFGSQAFQDHADEIRSIIIRSQIFKVAKVYNDDPGSGLYHFGIVIQKDKILPAVTDIATAMGIAVTDDQKKAISDGLDSAKLPGFDVWIGQSSLAINRIRIDVSRGAGTVQTLDIDATLLPLVGNPPMIAAPDSATPLDQILNPAPVATTTLPAKAATEKK